MSIHCPIHGIDMGVVHTNSPTVKPTYQLACLCGWHVDAPTNYLIARAVCWAHQQKVPNGQPHVVEFVAVN